MKNEKMSIREKAQYLEALADALDSIDERITRYMSRIEDAEGNYKTDPETGEYILQTPSPEDWQFMAWRVWKDIKAAAESLA